MLKIKKSSGITLVSLVVTIIVLMIILGITVNISLDSIEDTRKQKLEAELNIIQHACITEYTKAKKLGYMDNFKENLEDNNIPPNFVGEYIKVSDLNSNIDWVINSELEKSEAYKGYFRLTPDDLKLLTISDSEYTYIVNYYTGEVYNETKNDSSLYIKSGVSHIEEESLNNNSDNLFVDDNF